MNTIQTLIYSLFILFFPLQSAWSTRSLKYQALWQIAEASLKHNIIQIPSGAYLRAGPKHFGSLWTRDFCFSIKGLLAIGETQVVRDHLDKLIKERKKNLNFALVPRVLDNMSSAKRVMAHTLLPFIKVIPLNDPLNPEYIGEHKTIAMDSNALVVLGAIEYYKYTNDHAWWNKNKKGIIEIYKFYHQYLNHGLITQGKYADWQDSVTREGKTLFVNFLFWKAAKELRKIDNTLVSYDFLKNLKATILKTFYDPSSMLFSAIEGHNYISLDANLLILDDADFLESYDMRYYLYKALVKHPLWVQQNLPGSSSYPDYPKEWRSTTTRLSGLSHYHDQIYWSWLMGFSGKIATKYNDSYQAQKIFSTLEQIALRDNTISEIYRPIPGLPRFESFAYKSSAPFSWGSAMILESLSYDQQSSD